MADAPGYTDADAPTEDGFDRTPPHDLMAEQSTVGGMLIENRVIDDVLELLKPSDFYIPKHEIITRAIARLHAKGDPADVLTVGAEIQRSGEVTRAGGIEYLHELTSLTPTGANAPFYAKRVAELSVHRRLIVAGTRITSMGYASEGEPEELLEQARVEVDGAMTSRKRSAQMIGETFDALIDDLDKKPEYLPSSFGSIDKMIGGLAPGSLYIVAARPGAGKSIAVMQMAVALSRKGMVAFSSLEMTEAELQMRLLAQVGSVHMQSLRNHDLSPIQWKLVMDARTEVQGAPIFIDDSAGATLAEIRTHARAVARRGRLTGIVVDYLQLVVGEGADRRLQVASVSKGLKQMAKDFGVPVIAAAQLKRGTRLKGAASLPTIEDLREAGEIEQDADVVILLHRDQEKRPRDLVAIVAKNRHGEQGRVTLSWQAEFARIRDKQWSPTNLFEEAEMAQ